MVRPTADIAYAIGRGHRVSSVQLDNLRFGPQTSAVTNAREPGPSASCRPGPIRWRCCRRPAGTTRRRPRARPRSRWGRARPSETSISAWPGSTPLSPPSPRTPGPPRATPWPVSRARYLTDVNPNARQGPGGGGHRRRRPGAWQYSDQRRSQMAQPGCGVGGQAPDCCLTPTGCVSCPQPTSTARWCCGCVPGTARWASRGAWSTCPGQGR